jgi:methionyl-tRNA formyltransferase
VSGRPLNIAFLSAVNNLFVGRILQAFRRQGLDPKAIIMDENRPSGAKEEAIWAERTQGRLPPLLLSSVAGNALPCFFVSSHCGRDTLALIRDLDIDLLVSATTPRILTQDILTAAKHGVLGVHPGLLPQYRGCTCVEWAIFNDDPVGNSAFIMTRGIDEGPVVLQEALRFSPSDRYTDVRIKVYEHGIDLLARAALRIQQEQLLPENLPVLAGGRYFEVIDTKSMTTVHDRLNAGEYAFQR